MLGNHGACCPKAVFHDSSQGWTQAKVVVADQPVLPCPVGLLLRHFLQGPCFQDETSPTPCCLHHPLVFSSSGFQLWRQFFSLFCEGFLIAADPLQPKKEWIGRASCDRWWVSRAEEEELVLGVWLGVEGGVQAVVLPNGDSHRPTWRIS